MDRRRRVSLRGFTLIELLIVVAIIAILALIAVPNFLEAQTRAKVSRLKADMRTAATALEAYAVDHNTYPFARLALIAGWSQINRGGIFMVIDLTTPIAYLTSLNLKDPFIPEIATDRWGDIPAYHQSQGSVSRTFNYMNIDMGRAEWNLGPTNVHWVLISYGPDHIRGPIPGVSPPYLHSYARDPIGTNYYAAAWYDPTNGTVSGGDILMWQGRGG